MANITKIYEIKLQGQGVVLEEMQRVNQQFEQAKRNWQSLREQLSRGGLSGTETARLTAETQAARLETERLKQETIRLRNEGIATANANRLQAQEQRNARNEARQSVGEYQRLNQQYKDAKNNALNVGAALGTNSREFREASAEARRYYNQLRQIEAGVGVFNRNVGNYPRNVGANISNNIRQYFDDLKGQMASFAVGYIGFQSALSLGTRIKDDVIAFDSMNTALEGVSEKTGDLAVNQEFLARITEKLGLKTLDTTKNFKSFFAAATESGIGASIAREIFENASEASAKMKLSQEQTNGVMLAFGQIASKGKVQAEELRGQIGERIPGAFAIAARAMGMTTAELDAAMKKGEVYSTDFLPKFAAELKKTYSTGQEPVKGLQAELNRVDNMISKIGGNKSFISAVSTTVSIISVLITLLAKVPFSVWLGFIGLITLAYWANIQAMIAKNVQLAITIIRLGLTNGAYIILNATYNIHLALIGLLRGAYQLMIVTLDLMGISTVKLRQTWIAFNALLSATPWGLIIGLIAAAGAATFAYARSTENATIKLKEHGKTLIQNINHLKVQDEINKRAGDSIAGISNRIKLNTAILNDNNSSLRSKKQALQNIIDINPQYLKGLTLENFHTAEGIKILDAYKNKLLEVAKAKAVQQSLEEDYKKQFELDNERSTLKKEKDNYVNSKFWSKTNFSETGKAMLEDFGVGDGSGLDRYNKNLKETEEITDRIRYKEAIFKKNVEKGINPNDPILGGISTTPAEEEKKKKEKKYSGSRLTGTQKDYLKDLEANRDKELAILETLFTRGRILEEDYIKRSLKVNQGFYDKKINYLKSGNAEERKQEAKAILDKIKAEGEANDKLYNIYKKRYDDELKLSEQSAKDKQENVLKNPYSTDNEKLEAEKTYHQESLDAQMIYTQKMLDLNIQYSKNTSEETNKLLSEQKQRLDAANLNNLESKITATQNAMNVVDDGKEYLSNQNEINAALQRKEIINNKSLSFEQKKIELEKISAELQLKNTNTELGSVLAKISLFEIEIDKRQLTNDELREYNRLLREKAGLEEKKASDTVNAKAVGAKTTFNTVGEGSSGLASQFTNSLKSNDTGQITIGGKDVTAEMGQAIAQGFSLAETAMNNYFDAERQRVEQSKQLAYERIDLEKQQLLRFAQSNSERDSIEKQANEKRKKADKEAGEKLKKIKKAEARIAFLMELANIWSTAFQLGPIAGPIMGAVLSTLATVKFAATMSNIDKVQYGFGGLFKRMFGLGGKFKKMFGMGGRIDNGTYHSENNGMPIINPKTNEVEAFIEKDEAIINKNSMKDSNTYTVSGTPSQIASKINTIGGGVDWAGGATLSKFMNGGPYLGSNLQPPVFRSYYETSGSKNSDNSNSERIAVMEEMLNKTIETLNREVNRPTTLNPNKVTDYQKEYQKQTDIGTL